MTHTREQNDGQLEQIFLAAKNDKVDILKELLLKGVDPNLRDSQGWTPLMVASYFSNYDCVKLLLKAGANPDLQNTHSCSALQYSSCNVACCKLILKTVVNVNLQYMLGWTALISSSFNGKTDCCKLLLKAGANPNIQNDYDCTALERAINQGHTDCVTILKNYHLLRRNYPTVMWCLSSRINRWVLKATLFKNTKK